MDDAEILQNSEEWRQARCGSLGASQIALALARTKTGWGASRANVMATIIAEKLTGVPEEGYVSEAMRRGKELEAEARLAYELRTGAGVQQVGLVRHPTIVGTHASPDGLIGEHGLIEIKVPNLATHVDYLISQQIPMNYQQQMAWQLICTGRKCCDFCSYAPQLPASMQLFIRPFTLPETWAKEMESEVATFLKEVDRKVDDLRHLYERGSSPTMDALRSSVEAA